MSAGGVKDMYLCIVQRDDYVCGCKMERSDNALIWRDLASVDVTAMAPSSLNLIALFEVGSVGYGLGATATLARRVGPGRRAEELCWRHHWWSGGETDVSGEVRGAGRETGHESRTVSLCKVAVGVLRPL
jgi:hypothetical protein